MQKWYTTLPKQNGIAYYEVGKKECIFQASLGAREFIVCDEACAVVASMIPNVDPYCYQSFLMAL